MIISLHDRKAMQDMAAGRRLLRQGLDYYVTGFPSMAQAIPLIFEQLVLKGPLSLQKQRRHKKGKKVGRRPQSTWVKAAVKLANLGYLTPMLNSRLPMASQIPKETQTKLSLSKRRLPYFGERLPQGIGPALRSAFHRSQWAGVQAAILVLRQNKECRLTDSEWDHALMESVVYGWAKFYVSKCRYENGHWFVQDDKRLKDCRRHRDMVRTARYRAKKKAEAQKARATKAS